MRKFLFLIGCAKSGTTSLAHYLGDGDSMMLGIEKEPKLFTNFANQKWSGPASEGFTNSIILDEASYINNFPGITDSTWAIDASTDYIWNAGTADRIAKFAEKHTTKLICITRDPISRAISEYNHTLGQNWEPLSFGASLDQEAVRMEQGWIPLFYHLRRSQILSDLTQYKNLFGDDLLVLGFEELNDPNRIVAKVRKFLDLSPQPIISSEIQNQTALPRNALTARLLNNETIAGLGRLLFRPAMRQKVRKSLYVDSKLLATVKPHEEEKLRGLLTDEIVACLESPLIPTSSWLKATNTK